MKYRPFLLRVGGMAIGTAAILIVIGEFDWRGPAAIFYGLFAFFVAVPAIRLLRVQNNEADQSLSDVAVQGVTP